MAGLADTTAALKRLRKGLGGGAFRPPVGRLNEVADFGSNPGALRMLTFAPATAPKPALVVVLHGCTQTAEGYQHGAGWATLAERYGFVLLCPEQSPANNPNRCFNWFEPGDIRRGQGEVASIHQMIETAARLYDVDRSRIFVTGLSAGGAMTSAMLATYPETFAAGAIIAGLPYGGADNVQQAFACMMQTPLRPAAEWGERVRAASPHSGPWPRVAVWHGEADSTVSYANAGEIIKQWRDVHDIASVKPNRSAFAHGFRREAWLDDAGAPVVESFSIPGMGHGTPISARGDEGCGAVGPFLLEVGVSSSFEIAKDWGLIHDHPNMAAAATRAPGPEQAHAAGRRHRGLIDIEAIIKKALGAAGLLK
jgi:poly(hydroxyalkanoate) depolymerase family esterase